MSSSAYFTLLLITLPMIFRHGSVVILSGYSLKLLVNIYLGC